MKTGFVIVLLAFITLNGFAQLENIETRRRGDKQGLQGSISLSLDLQKNTRQIFQARNTIALQYKDTVNTILLINDISFLQVNSDEALTNNSLQHFRYNYTPTQTNGVFTIEVFSQHQNNRVKLLDTRFLSGVGPRFRLLGSKDKPYYFYLSTLVMYEYEKLIEDIENLADEDDMIAKKFKGDFIFSIGMQLTPTFAINHVTYYQPDISEWSDFRLSSDTGMFFKISTHLSASINYSFNYDSKPPMKNIIENDVVIGTEPQIPDLFFSLNHKLKFTF